MASVKKTILSRGAIFVCLMTEPILLLGITEIGQSEALKPCLTNSQHIHKLTITHHRHHFDGTLDINQRGISNMWNMFTQQHLLFY